MVSKSELEKLYQKEFATTTRILQAFPADKMDFTPHERSSSAKKLMSTFIFELYLLSAYAFGIPLDRSKFQTYKPNTVKEVMDDFANETANFLTGLKAMPEDTLAKTVEFGGRSYTVDEFMLMMLFDQIHHRGQLSVYVRMAGGKVPSIYGPSADDPSTNL